jgi:LPXTG-motif cell wall-anchored protein
MGARTFPFRGHARVVRQIAVVLLLAGPAYVALGSAPASANSGAVSATQNCQTWHVSVSLNHDTQPDRSVDVLTTIPGTTGISGGHYDTSFGEIWSAGGAAPTSGSVTLNIYFANGQLEFTQTKSLPVPEGCVTTTTAVPTTTTTIASEGTTVPGSTSTSVGSTVPGSTTIVTEGANATTTAGPASVAATTGGTSAVGAATLPRTGSGGWGPAVGFASLLGGGAMLLLSRRRRPV